MSRPIVENWLDTKNPTGQDIYRNLGSQVGSERASELLNEAGIPGIRFLDGNSRSAKEGTRNIVVFNPDDIKQVKRDGELVYGGTKASERWLDSSPPSWSEPCADSL